MKKYQDIEYNFEYDGNGKLIDESRQIIQNGKTLV